MVRMEVANRAGMSHEMSTPNRGRLLMTTAGNLIGKRDIPEGRDAANLRDEPDDYAFGPSGCDGVNDPCGSGCS